MEELRLLVSPVRPQRRILEPTKKNILPIVRGRFNNLIEVQQGSDGGDSVPVGLFMKSTKAKVESCASPEVHEKVASGSSPGASLFFPSGCSPTGGAGKAGGESGARLHISVAKVEATEKSMREVRMKICTSPVRKHTRDGSGSGTSGQPAIAPTAAASAVSAALTQKRLHASAGSNPWAQTPSSGSGAGGAGGGRSSGRSRGGQPSGSALSLSKSLNLSQRRSSSAAHAVVPHTTSVTTTTRAMSRERARARSSHSDRDGCGSGVDRSNGGGSGGTQGEIEMYRAAAHSRIAKALEKQRVAKALVAETESSRRQRGDNAGVKQKERHRYRAEIYAINALLKKYEKDRFSEFKKGRLECECEAAAQNNDDASIDSDDSGSIGDEVSPPSPGRSQTSMSPARGGGGGGSGSSGSGLTVNTAPGSPHKAVAPFGSPAPSPSKFGGV
jgi:hypothetical protein